MIALPRQCGLNFMQKEKKLLVLLTRNRSWVKYLKTTKILRFHFLFKFAYSNSKNIARVPMQLCSIKPIQRIHFLKQ